MKNNCQLVLSDFYTIRNMVTISVKMFWVSLSTYITHLVGGDVLYGGGKIYLSMDDDDGSDAVSDEDDYDDDDDDGLSSGGLAAAISIPLIIIVIIVIVIAVIFVLKKSGFITRNGKKPPNSNVAQQNSRYVRQCTMNTLGNKGQKWKDIYPRQVLIRCSHLHISFLDYRCQ